MSDSPILRQADARDADLIAAMHADSWARTYRGLLPDGFLDQEVVQDRLVHWQHKIAGPEQGAQAIFIAELDGRPIGFVCVKDDPDSPWGVLLDNLHVLAPWQGTGAGKLLMRRALDWRVRAAPARSISTRWRATRAPSRSTNARAGRFPAWKTMRSPAFAPGRGATSIRCSAWRPNSAGARSDNSIRFRSGSRR